jgi:hypothetical protein
MADENIPMEIGREKFTPAPGLEIEVINLDNGMRLVTEDSLEKFVAWLEAGTPTIEGKK